MNKHLDRIFKASLSLVLVLTASAGALSQTKRKPANPRIQTVRVLINEQGYSPGSFKLKKGVPAKVTFLRQTDKTCATEIVFPAYGINMPLPLNQPVVVSFTPAKAGEFGFTCGMNMMRGKLFVQ